MRLLISICLLFGSIAYADEEPRTYTFTFTAEQVRIIAAAVNQATATGYGRPLLNEMDAAITKQDDARKQNIKKEDRNE